MLDGQQDLPVQFVPKFLESKISKHVHMQKMEFLNEYLPAIKENGLGHGRGSALGQPTHDAGTSHGRGHGRPALGPRLTITMKVGQKIPERPPGHARRCVRPLDASPAPELFRTVLSLVKQSET